MTTSPPTPELDAELVRVLRELVAAAIAARPYVSEALDDSRRAGLREVAMSDAERLDRLDAAIADAGDVLPGSSS